MDSASVNPERNRVSPAPSSARSPQLRSEPTASVSSSKPKARSHDNDQNATDGKRRRCISTACISCRKRKSRCDGNTPSCAACANVYFTECVYSPHTDHRRKGVYKKDIDTLKTRNSTLQVLIQAILNREEDEVPDLVRQIRTCENLEELAESVAAKASGQESPGESPDSPIYGADMSPAVPAFEAELSGKMRDLLLDGSVKFVGGTSNLIGMPNDARPPETIWPEIGHVGARTEEEALLSWTSVTKDKELIRHLMHMYFCWHYAYFTTLDRTRFLRDFRRGQRSQYCSALLVNVMLALGCHFTSRPAARDKADESGSAGDHFFREAKKLMHENDEFASAKLCTVQALALMSVREAGCGREGKGWVYSGMSFRMALDLGLNMDVNGVSSDSKLTAEDIDARRITFWGCFLFDKCWSNYLGRQPQLPISISNVPKPDVFPDEEAEPWSPYTDSGTVTAHTQPSRSRTVALQITKLSEISSDLLVSFYHPHQLDKPMSKQAELKKLSDLHTRLEAWKKDLPHELEPRDGQLPQVLLMHMFFQLLFIHLYRPFLKYNKSTSPLPSHVSPRKFCTQAAGAISKLLRLYKRTYGLRQICNIAVYIAHSACTIHLLNLPDKNAKRDIVHGVKHLEEIGEMWTCARRTLRILNLTAEKWDSELPEEAETTFRRAKSRWGASEPAPEPGSAEHSPSLILPPIPNRAGPTPPSLPPIDHHNPMMSRTLSSTSFLASNGYFVPSAPPNGLPGPLPDLQTHMSEPSQSSHPHPLAKIDISSLSSARVRQAANLTQGQKDAWNSHQARLHAGNTSIQPDNHHSGGIPASAPADASIVFGGVDRLVDENQDWWLRDQSTLAMGFSNWGVESGASGPGARTGLSQASSRSRPPVSSSAMLPTLNEVAQAPPPQDWSLMGYGDATSDSYSGGYNVDEFSAYDNQGQAGKYQR